MSSQSEGAPGTLEKPLQRERRRYSEGMDPNSIAAGNVDIERLQRLADEGQRARERLCLLVRPCENPVMWVVVGTLAVGIGGLVVYGLIQVLERIL